MPTLLEIYKIMDRHYPFGFAEDWDSCGVILGEWDAQISRVLLSADLTRAVVDYAVAKNFGLVISHHPLWLGRHTPNSNPYKLDLAYQAAANQLALLNAHTNADIANPGVSDALAKLFNISNLLPLVPLSDNSVFGIGRVGDLPGPIALRDFVESVSEKLQDKQVQFAGDPAQLVSKVAVVGGSGDAFLASATAAAVDVYITSDIRHHPLQEHLEAGGCAVININHSLAESVWLADLAKKLTDVEVEISRLNTLGWN